MGKAQAISLIPRVSLQIWFCLKAEDAEEMKSDSVWRQDTIVDEKEKGD